MGLTIYAAKENFWALSFFNSDVHGTCMLEGVCCRKGNPVDNHDMGSSNDRKPHSRFLVTRRQGLVQLGGAIERWLILLRYTSQRLVKHIRNHNTGP